MPRAITHTQSTLAQARLARRRPPLQLSRERDLRVAESRVRPPRRTGAKSYSSDHRHVVDTGIPDGIKVDARGRIYVGCGDGVHILSRDGELLGKIKLPGKDPAANLAFGKGKHKSTLYVLDETSVTAVELPGTRGARVGRERKFDVGRVRYKST